MYVTKRRLVPHVLPASQRRRAWCSVGRGNPSRLLLCLQRHRGHQSERAMGPSSYCQRYTVQTLLTALGVGVFGLPVLVVLVLLACWPPLIHTAAARMDTSTGTAVLRSAAPARDAGRRERAGRYATGTADRQTDRQSLHLHTSQ